MNKKFTNIRTRRGSKDIKINISIPLKIVDALKARFGGLELDRALKVIDRVFAKTKGLEGDYHHFSAWYRRRVSTNRHKHIWQDLVDADILERKTLKNGKYYSTARRKAMHYRINPELMKGRFVDAKYWKSMNGKEFENETYQALNTIELHMPEGMSIDQFLVLDKPNIIKKVKSKTTVYKKSVHYDIGGEEPEIKRFDTINKKLLEEFYEEKTISHIEKYKAKLKQFKFRNFESIKRNNTNYRLNHTLTNFPSRYLGLCTMEGENIFELDLKNSQFALLANYIENSGKPIFDEVMCIDRLSPLYSSYSTIFKPLYPINTSNNYCHPHWLLTYFNKSDDVKMFSEECYSGKLYDNISIQLDKENPPERQEVKKMLFGMLFGNHNFIEYGYLNKVFMDKFPNVVGIIKQLKQYYTSVYFDSEEKEVKKFIEKAKNTSEAGRNFLAIGLQRLEAKIFIDNILCKLFDKGFLVLTRHDSILCKESDKDEVSAIVKEELNRILGEGKYTLKSELQEYEFPEVAKLEV